jgi:hypothetical protein
MCSLNQSTTAQRFSTTDFIKNRAVGAGQGLREREAEAGISGIADMGCQAHQSFGGFFDCRASCLSVD